MADIPTYERQVTFAPQAITSSATTYEALNVTVGGVQKALEQDVKKQATDALAASKFMTATDIIKHSSVMFDDSQKITDKQQALDEFRVGYQAYADTVIAKTPKPNRLYTERLLFSLGNKGAKKIQQQIVDQGKLVALTQTKDTLHALNAQTMNSASDPTVNSQTDAMTYAGNIVSVVKGAVGRKQMAASGGAVIISKMHQDLNKARIIAQGRLVRSEPNGSQKFRDLKSKVLGKGYDKIFSRDEKKQVIGEMDKDAALDLQRAARSQQQYENMKKDATLQVSTTGNVSSTLLAKIHDISPEEYADWANGDLRLAQANGAKLSLTQYAPLPQAFNALGEAKKSLTQEELNKPGAAKELQYRAKYADSLGKQITAFQENPATYTQTDPEFQKEDAILRTGYITYPESDPRYAKQNEDYQAARRNLLKTFQRERGLTHEQLSVIDGEEAKGRSIFLNGLRASEVPNANRDIEQEFGDDTNLAMRNLTKAGANPVNNWIRGITSNPKSAPHASAIIQGFQLGRKESFELLKGQKVTTTKLTTAVNTALEPYYGTIHSMNGDTLGYKLKTRTDVEQATMGIMITDGKNLQEASQTAADAMVNNHYQYLSFTPGLFATAARTIPSSFIANKIGAGATFRIPANADPVSYMKAVNAIYVTNTLKPPKDLIVPSYVEKQFPLRSDAERREIYINDNFKNGSFTNNESDDGIVYVDKNGIPAQTVSGGTIGMLHDDLNDPNSDVYKNIAQMEIDATRLSKEAFAKQFGETISAKTKFFTEPTQALESATESSIKDLSRASFGVKAEIAQSDILSPTFKKLIKQRKKE